MMYTLVLTSRTGQYDSHQIIGGAEWKQDCGDYAFNIKVADEPTSTALKAPDGTWPTALSSTTACWFSGTPGKKFHTKRVTAFASSQCELLATSISVGLAPKRTDYNVAGFDFPDEDPENSQKADLSSDVNYYSKGEEDQLGGEDCIKGFLSVVDECTYPPTFTLCHRIGLS